MDYVNPPELIAEALRAAKRKADLGVTDIRYIPPEARYCACAGLGAGVASPGLPILIGCGAG
jgi:hypothetical protein